MNPILDDEFLSKKTNLHLPNYKKAKFICKGILWLIGFIFLISMLFGRSLRSDLREVLMGVPGMIIVLSAPVGLFFIIRSYHQKEIVKRKFVYLWGLGIINLMTTALSISFFFEIYNLFYKK